MSDQEINIAIAEFCGWEKPKLFPERWFASDPVWWNETLKRKNEPLPKYCTDLNAMHEAETELFKRFSRGDYLHQLKELCRSVFQVSIETCVTASAHQRAEALLRTTGKWKD